MPILDFAYNSAQHETTRLSPFMLMYGFQPCSPIIVGLGIQQIQHLKELLQDCVNMLQVACLHVRQAEDHYKKYVDVKRCSIQFQEGE